MSDKDKLKDFLDQNLKKDFKKPTNEWSEIVEKIDSGQTGQGLWGRWMLIGGGTLVAGVLAVLLWNSSVEPFEATPEQRLEISNFLIEAQSEIEMTEDEEDYSYLALIE